MSPTLGLLLSDLYDSTLAPAHRADLEKSTLTGATIRAHFIRSVPPHLIDRLLGFRKTNPTIIRSALLFPYRAAGGGFMDHTRVKVFPGCAGLKYLGPKGAPPRLYFTTWSLPVLRDPTVPVWLVEGVKKSLAVGQQGHAAVGFEGCDAWHVKHTTALLPDFDALALEGRTVELLPDGDWQTNRAVLRGSWRLADALARRGARPRLVVLPDRLDAA